MTRWGWLVLVSALTGCAAPVAITATRDPATGIVRLPAPAKLADLLGASPDRVMASLGLPVLRRKDGDAEVWLYAGDANCRADLVFYRSAAALKLADARTRTKAAGAPAETACLRQIAALPPR